jgi:hypothetical protein
MNKSFLTLFVSAALVACAPGQDGADGAAGMQGTAGGQGETGAVGNNGADAPARVGNIVSVTGGSVVAGGTAQMHVIGQYTEWTEAPVITTEYEGLSLAVAINSPVSMTITISAAADVRGGEANLLMGELQLPKTIVVIPAASFVYDEEQSNPLRPGETFSGTIVFAPGFGLAGQSGVKTSEGEDGPQDVLFTSISIEGSQDLGPTGIALEGFISPSAPAGVMNWRVETRNGTQTIPVYGAVEVSDSPAVELTLGGNLDASLDNGFALYKLTRGEGALINAGTVLRAEVQNAAFPVVMSITLPASGDDMALLWSNEDTALDATSNTIELLAPRTGVYFLSVNHGELEEEGVALTFNASVEQVQITMASGQEQAVTIARPGHGAWFARGVAAGQTLFWDIDPADESDATPALYSFRNYTDEDGNDIFGGGLSFGGDAVLSGYWLGRYGQGIAWPESWGESVFIWRIVDANLGGGGGYDMTFTGGVR